MGMGLYLSLAGSKGRLVEAGGSEASREQLAELLVAQPIRAMATHAAELLIRRIRGEEFTPVREVYPLKLIVRSSCGTAGSG